MKAQIRYRELDGYKYQLAEDYETVVRGAYGQPQQGAIRTIAHPEINPLIRLTLIQGFPAGSLLRISRGYSWDGPSGPTIDTPNFMRGSLVHDALYQMIRERLIPIECKDQADQELRRICLEDGMSAARAWYVYQAVKHFAGSAAAPRDVEPIEIIKSAP